MVDSQLLATKILPARSGLGLIERPRLLAEVARIATRQVSMIKGGHGYGKTSLAAAWADKIQQNGELVAWLSLDADDDEPARFLFYMSHALHRADARIGKTAVELVSDISLVSLNTVIAALINDLAEIDAETYLFLDDYQKITDPEIQNAVSYLLRYAPEQFHLVLIATGEVALPLARLRANNQLFELDISVLRFDVAETRQLLERENIDGLDAAGVRLLQAKTEGWPAVLRIVVATLCQPGQDFQRYVAALSGAVRQIGGYFSELLDALPRDLVQFMVRISILESFSAPLCQAVTTSRLSHDLLDALEAGQVLLTPLDEDKRWYRFHPLLREHLQKRLDLAHDDELTKLHRRAYRWYAVQELWTEAIRHAIAAGDSDQAVVWIERCAMDLVKQGNLLTLLGWQRLFPTELERSKIEVGLAVAWGLALAMRFNEALRLVGDVRRESGAADAPAVASVDCECDAITAVVAALRDDTVAALPIAESCLARSNDPWTANVASNVALFSHWKASDLELCYAVPWIPYSADGDRLNLFTSIYRRCLQGLVEFQQLRLAAAERCYLDAIGLAERHAGPNSVAAALPASLLARIRYEQGRFDEAEALVVDRMTIIDTSGMLECVLNAYLVQVEIADSRRNIERVFSLLDQFESIGHLRDWGRAVAAALLVRLRLNLGAGRLEEANANLKRLERLAAEYAPQTRCAWSEVRLYFLQARAYVASAENHPADAAAIWQDLGVEAEAARDRYLGLRTALKLSEALLADERSEAAQQLLCETLRTAAAAGVYQTVLDNTSDLGGLLLRARDEGRQSSATDEISGYIATLIEGWQERYDPGAAPSPAGQIADELSPRERTIVECMDQGRSNKEIGRKLGISPETVKSHIKNIFVKLGVDRRAQAVSRAKSLSLIG